MVTGSIGQNNEDKTRAIGSCFLIRIKEIFEKIMIKRLTIARAIDKF